METRWFVHFSFFLSFVLDFSCILDHTWNLFAKKLVWLKYIMYCSKTCRNIHICVCTKQPLKSKDFIQWWPYLQPFRKIPLKTVGNISLWYNFRYLITWQVAFILILACTCRTCSETDRVLIRHNYLGIGLITITKLSSVGKSSWLGQ